jgi:hypothetical protein
LNSAEEVDERKEVKTMKYEKPELVAKASAVHSIQQQAGGFSKGSLTIYDVVTGANDSNISVAAAYEADE